MEEAETVLVRVAEVTAVAAREGAVQAVWTVMVASSAAAALEED